MKKKASIPESDLADIKSLQYFICTTYRLEKGKIVIEASPAFSTVPPREYNNLFLKKCKECKKICDFSKTTKDKIAKNRKSTILSHLIEGLKNTKLVKNLSEQCNEEFQKMIEINLSRSFHQMCYNTKFGDHIEDLAWPHLSKIYEASLLFYASANKLSLRHAKYLKVFVHNCLSPDQREREASSKVILSIFQNQKHFRNPIFKEMSYLTLNGHFSNEILSFFDAALSSDAQIVKIFSGVLLDMHLLPEIFLYFDKFIKVVKKFIAIQPAMANIIVKYIITHWPITDVSKQVIFFEELTEIIKADRKAITTDSAVRLAKHLSSTIADESVDVAGAAADLLLSDAMHPFVNAHRTLLVSSLFQPALGAASKHWSADVRDDCSIILTFLAELDGRAFDAQSARATKVPQTKRTKRPASARVPIEPSDPAVKRRAAWEKIERAASKRFPGLKLSGKIL